ncbi:hypothetical protein BDW66DRAFT_125305 [Aspergillus desertorum]
MNHSFPLTWIFGLWLTDVSFIYAANVSKQGSILAARPVVDRTLSFERHRAWDGIKIQGQRTIPRSLFMCLLSIIIHYSSFINCMKLSRP